MKKLAILLSLLPTMSFSQNVEKKFGEWAFFRDGSFCSLASSSLGGETWLNYVAEDGNISLFIVSQDSQLMALPEDKIVNVSYQFDGQGELDGGDFMRVGQRPDFEPNTGLWTFLMATEPSNSADHRWMTGNAVDVYVDGNYVAGFSLNGSSLGHKALLECGM